MKQRQGDQSEALQTPGEKGRMVGNKEVANSRSHEAVKLTGTSNQMDVSGSAHLICSRRPCPLLSQKRCSQIIILTMWPLLKWHPSEMLFLPSFPSSPPVILYPIKLFYLLQYTSIRSAIVHSLFIKSPPLQLSTNSTKAGTTSVLVTVESPISRTVPGTKQGARYLFLNK